MAGYYDKLAAFLDHTVTEAFVKAVHREMLIFDDNAERLLDTMATYAPPKAEKWLERFEL